MGYLAYEGLMIEFDDRLLVHLEIVIVNKLRRRESFSMSWRDAPEIGHGRSTIWLDPSIPLYFKFDGSRSPAIDRDWLEALGESAAGPHGLIVTDENGDSPPVGRRYHSSRPEPSPVF